MGIVNPFMVKNAIGKTAGQTLELEADPGQSFLVKDILIGENDATMTDITVDKAMVGRYRTAKTLGNHLGFPYGMGLPEDAAVQFRLKPRFTILEYLAQQGLFAGFPIAEGQKMVISPAVAAEYLGDVQIVYEEYEGSDITSEQENGSESTEYMIINYGDAGAAITAAGTFHINNQNSPTEFPQFPYGKVVPAKTEIDLLGILASDVHDEVDSTHYMYTTYLKLVRERSVLFDDDRNGLLFKGGHPVVTDAVTYYGLGNSKIGNYSDVDIKRPFMLKEPITFGAGEELNIYTIIAEADTTAAFVQADTEIGLIMKIRRVS